MQPLCASFLEHEARALLTRVARIKPFALSEPRVAAASLAPAAERAVEAFLARGRSRVRADVHGFLEQLRERSSVMTDEEAQRRFTLLRLRFNAICTQFDMFADALSQRSTQETGVFLAGLDRLAADALAMPEYYVTPPLLCYLDRGVGAAIRRARTRLPGGSDNPLAIIRVPRERMLGSAIAASLVHEVGHQAAALLDLVEAFRSALRSRTGEPWTFWDRWASEILADVWAVAKLGPTATLGLMSVLSLPRPFVVRISLDDPHPAPWLRVKLSCVVGHALYPHAQWQRLFELWQSLHPLRDADRRLSRLEASSGELVQQLLELQAPGLRGSKLQDVLYDPELQPRALAARYRLATADPTRLTAAAPCLSCAALGQARLDGALDPEHESELISRLLVRWALDNTFAQRAGAAAPLTPFADIDRRNS